MTQHERAVLRPEFERAKATLRTALADVCQADLDRADTGELIRIEEVLAIANEAAKEAVSVRRRLGSGQQAPLVESEPLSSREIDDARGVRWAVFAVHPSASGNRPAVRERFRDGWLSFDCGEETRRVAPIPDRWEAMSDDDLRQLCDRAEAAPRRRRRDDGKRAPGPTPLSLHREP